MKFPKGSISTSVSQDRHCQAFYIVLVKKLTTIAIQRLLYFIPLSHINLQYVHVKMLDSDLIIIIIIIIVAQVIIIMVLFRKEGCNINKFLTVS